MKYVIAACLISTSLLSWGWGSKGHSISAAIAQRHLTTKTAQVVDSLLEGDTMVSWASWADQIRSNSQYSYTKTWHYKNVDAGVDYADAPEDPDGDAVTAIKSGMVTLKNQRAPLADKSFALKMVVHIVGDLHQPMHMGHATDLGGNTISLKFLGSKTNLHKIWDSSLINEAHSWSYGQWATNIDNPTPAEVAYYAAGTVDDWARQTVEVAADAYDAMPAGSDVTQAQITQWTPVVERQLLAAGIRLATLLNGAFDPAASVTDITADVDAPVQYYNLQGISIDAPVPGQPAIRRQGNRSQLIIVR